MGVLRQSQRAPAALIFNGHASARRHEALCRQITSRGGAALMVRPPGAEPESEAPAGSENHAPGLSQPLSLDASRPEEVVRAFDTLLALGGPPDLVLFDGTPAPVRGLLDWTADEAERSWRGECLAALVVGREALKRMLPAGRGTVIFVGQPEDASLRAPFSMGQANKAGMRAVAQSMARGFGPRNIHVVHLALAPHMPPVLPEGLGEICWQLHAQHRTAWTHELDCRAQCSPAF